MTKGDIEIINLSGDVESLTEQLAIMSQRAETAEAQERLAIADIDATKRRMQADVDFWQKSAGEWKQRAKAAEAKYQCELEYRLTLSRTVNAELKLLNASTQRAEKWKARAEALEERNDTTPLDAIKTVLEYSEFQGWSNTEAVDAFRKLGDWLQFRV